MNIWHVSSKKVEAFTPPSLPKVSQRLSVGCLFAITSHKELSDFFKQFRVVHNRQYFNVDTP